MPLRFTTRTGGSLAKKFCCLCFVLLGFHSAVAVANTAARTPPVRLSVWYWLNSVSKTQWRSDFHAMRDLGFTDVLLVWGLDASAFSIRTVDSHEAIREAYKAGLRSSLFVWHARHSSLVHQKQFSQVDAAGHTLFAFDAFNKEWRKTQWKGYLQTLAREYGKEPGMTGYVFDNSFAIGRINSIDGPAPKPEENYLAYSNAEKRLFGKQPPTSPQDPAWSAWTEARRQWWADWASDTRAAIRGIDPNPQHAIVLEDGENTIDPDTEVRVGLDLARVIPFFDAMGAYWAPAYTSIESGPSGQNRLAAGVTAYLQRLRLAIGSKQELTLTLRLSESDTEKLPRQAVRPTLEQIEEAVNAALATGIRRIDFYGYRMGVYHLDAAGWQKYQPGSGETYPLTGQIEGKFLCDRPELWSGLKTYLHQIETTF